MIGIYKIESPSGKIYIGQSINIQKRISGYKQKGCKCQIKLSNSFKKYGIENHSFSVLEECNEQTLNNRERFYQELYNCIGPRGLNLRLTKDSDRSGRMSNEARARMVVFQQQAFTPERKARCAELARGNKNMVGKHHSSKTKAQMSSKKDTVKRKVIQLTKNGTIVKIYESTKAVEQDGFINQNVVQCCRGRRPTHHGFKWRYYDSR